MLMECRLKSEDDYYQRVYNNTDSNLKQKKINTTRKEEMDYLKKNNIVPKWMKKNGIRRGDGWTEEGKKRFYELLKMVKADRKRNGSEC